MADRFTLAADALQQLLAQYQGTNPDLKLESFGFFLDDYVISGASVTVNPNDLNVFDVSEAIVSFRDALYRQAATTFRVRGTGAKTYFLDFTVEDGFVFNTVHPSHLYLPLWTINTNASGDISSTVDNRGQMGYIRFREEIVGLIPTNVVVDEIHIANDAVSTIKLRNSSVTTVKIADLNVTEVKIGDNQVSYAKIKGPLYEGKMQLDYPTEGLANRLRIVEGSSTAGEVLAARASWPTLNDRLNAFDPGFVPVEHTWTATEGQTLFALPGVGHYDPGFGRIQLWVGGAPQYLPAFTETSANSFTLSEGVSAGTLVHARWYEKPIPDIVGHARAHFKGGYDELNIADLAGYEIIGNQGFDVTDSRFGAKGDGLTDSTSAVEQVMALAEQNQGGIVFFPKGTFVLQYLKLRPGVLVCGCGPETILKLKNGTNANLIVLNDNTVLQFGIRDLSIDGNKSNNTIGSGIYLYKAGYAVSYTKNTNMFDQNSIIENVRVYNCAEHGIRIDGAGSVPPDYVNVRAVRFKDVEMWGNVLDGINALNLTDCIFDQVVSHSNGRYGFYLSAANLMGTNCKTFFNGSNGFYFEANKRCRWVNIEAQENIDHGIYIHNGDTNYINALVDSNGRVGAEKIGVYVDGATDQVLDITANSFHFPTWQNYGVKFVNAQNINLNLVTKNMRLGDMDIDALSVVYGFINGSMRLGDIKILVAAGSDPITITTAAAGEVLAVFATERPWQFRQESTGATTALALQDKTGDKHFYIQDNTGNNVIDFWARIQANGRARIGLYAYGGLREVQQVMPFSTPTRPTADLITGMMIFDTTLNKPVWRNTANTGWVDATGATV